MIIKMVDKFKLTVVHFARPNPMQILASVWIYWAAGLLLAKPDFAGLN